MEQLSYAEIISSLALIASLGALAWNIVRDFVSDKVSVEFNIAFGEMGNIKNSNTSLFTDAGSLLPNHYFDNPGMLVEMINTGNKQIVLVGVGGKFKTGENFSMAVEGLPKMLLSYEIFSTMFTAKRNLIESVHKDEIEEFWVRDTKDKKWKLTKEGWKRLKKTADYIAFNKHIAHT